VFRYLRQSFAAIWAFAIITLNDVARSFQLFPFVKNRTTSLTSHQLRHHLTPACFLKAEEGEQETKAFRSHFFLPLPFFFPFFFAIFHHFSSSMFLSLKNLLKPYSEYICISFKKIRVKNPFVVKIRSICSSFLSHIQIFP